MRRKTKTAAEQIRGNEANLIAIHEELGTYFGGDLVRDPHRNLTAAFHLHGGIASQIGRKRGGGRVLNLGESNRRMFGEGLVDFGQFPVTFDAHAIQRAGDL